MSSQNREDGAKSEAEPSIWKSPVVVAAIMAPLIAGIFGLVQLFVPHQGEEGAGNEDITQTPVASEIAKDPRDLLVQASRILGNPEMPIDHRIEVIRALKQNSGEGAPPGYHEDAVTILVRYLNQTVAERRHVIDDFGIEYGPDPKITRPLSIVAALQALDTIRDVAPTLLEVRIGGIDFSFMNLSLLDLSGFYAGHSSFNSAFLSGCDCRGTNFNNADLRGVVVWTEAQSRFDGALFENTKLDGSKWKNVRLTGVDLSRVIGRPKTWEHIVPEDAQAIFNP